MAGRTGAVRVAWIGLLAAAVSGCLTDPDPRVDPPELGDAELRVLFVGNSLTYTHDVPGLVQAMAEADGRSFEQAALTAPNFSLQDHWFAGTPERIRDLAADVVVMQQGPSSLPANQDHLRYWSGRLAAVIREAGGEPALYMVWPSAARESAFPAVWEAYSTAADSVGGVFIPAGQTWVEAWALADTLALYGTDGYHPSYVGALAAAQTIYAVLYGLPADSVPTLDDDVPAATLTTLRSALAESLVRAGYGGP